jgi:hypothetical protein
MCHHPRSSVLPARTFCLSEFPHVTCDDEVGNSPIPQRPRRDRTPPIPMGDRRSTPMDAGELQPRRRCGIAPQRRRRRGINHLAPAHGRTPSRTSAPHSCRGRALRRLDLRRRSNRLSFAPVEPLSRSPDYRFARGREPANRRIEHLRNQAPGRASRPRCGNTPVADDRKPALRSARSALANGPGRSRRVERIGPCSAHRGNRHLSRQALMELSLSDGGEVSLGRRRRGVDDERDHSRIARQCGSRGRAARPLARPAMSP